MVFFSTDKVDDDDDDGGGGARLLPFFLPLRWSSRGSSRTTVDVFVAAVGAACAPLPLCRPNPSNRCCTGVRTLLLLLRPWPVQAPHSGRPGGDTANASSDSTVLDLVQGGAEDVAGGVLLAQ